MDLMVFIFETIFSQVLGMRKCWVGKAGKDAPGTHLESLDTLSFFWLHLLEAKAERLHLYVGECVLCLPLICAGHTHPCQTASPLSYASVGVHNDTHKWTSPSRDWMVKPNHILHERNGSFYKGRPRSSQQNQDREPCLGHGTWWAVAWNNFLTQNWRWCRIQLCQRNASGIPLCIFSDKSSGTQVSKALRPMAIDFVFLKRLNCKA